MAFLHVLLAASPSGGPGSQPQARVGLTWLAMSRQAVEAEVTEDSPLALRAALLQARFLLGGPGAHEGALAGLEELLKDPVAPSNGTLLYCAGACLHVAGRSDEALTLNHTGVTLENLGLCVAVGLALDRADFAGDVLTRMQAQDDDDTSTQLATAWVGAYVGGARAREALVIYEELGGRWQWTPQLLNGAAAASLVMHEWSDAEQYLQRALAANPKDADALANMFVACQHLGKNSERALAALRSAAPEHPLLQKRGALEADFRRVAAQYS